MAEEVVVDCSTGEVTVQPDTFLAIKPALPPPPPPPPNANQVLMNALLAIPSTDGGYNVAQTVLKVLQGQPAVPAI